MIKTIGDLLQSLMVREAAVLAEQRIEHAPTIGAMYEGLTQELIRRSLPIAVPVSVVTGFATGADGQRSRQLDCMLVTGDGERIPHTDSFIYPIDQVLAVIEVKKSLYKAEFDSAFQNLQSLRLKPTVDRPLRRSIETPFQMISGYALLDDPNDVQDPVLKQLLYQLMLEAASPARIVLGYEGYKTVGALRRGVAEHLATLTGTYGAGPSSIPDLIINPNAAVVKANGFPYVSHLTDGSWPLLLSAASALPATTLLEVIWTRLSVRIDSIAMNFGEDLEIDSLTKLADYRYLPGHGWEVVVFNVDSTLLHVDTWMNGSLYSWMTSNIRCLPGL